MPTPTATLRRDTPNGFPWGLSFAVGEGYSGVRSYEVDTDDLELSITAAGLPQPFESWSIDRPTLVCTGLVPYEHSWQHSKVIATYKPMLAGSGNGPPPAPEAPPGTSFCVFSNQNEGLTLFSEVDDNGDLVEHDYQINDGNGMPAFVGRTVIEVWVYYNPGAVPDVNTFADFCGDKARNKDSLVLPPLIKTAQRFTIEPEKLLYMDWKLNATASGTLCAVHTFWFSPQGHKFIWAPINAAGGTSLVTRVTNRYRKENFASFWPQK